MLKRLPPFELIFWLAGLLALALAAPDAPHLSLCPLANLGWEWCPGCGLGRGIAQLFQGNFLAALRQHWFALPALAIIGYRIIQLSRQFILSLKPVNQP